MTPGKLLLHLKLLSRLGTVAVYARLSFTAALTLAFTHARAEVVVPAPRVAATYTSWPNGSYQFKTSNDAIFAQLGWPYVRVENTALQEVLEDLDRFDLFFPVNLYNYVTPQPFDEHLDQWVRFLRRGGIIVGLDANYGAQIDWLTKLGDGLALRQRKCEIACQSGNEVKVTVAAPDDPFAPLPDMALPWGHFESFGPAWKVLGTCPDGHPICLKAGIGKGVVVATTYHTERGYPSLQYLTRLWEAHCRKLMDNSLTVQLDRGPEGVGRKMLRLEATRKAAVLDAGVLCMVRRQGEAWETLQAPLKAAANGATVVSFPYRAASGRTDVRVVVREKDQALWWTSFVCQTTDVKEAAARLLEKLRRCEQDLRVQPEARALRRWHDELCERVRTVEAADNELLGALAGEQTRAQWDELGRQLAQLDEKATVLCGRADVGARVATESGEAPGLPFAVIRSHALEKLHRDSPPSGPWRGSLRLEAARGESESAQLGIVPLQADLENVRVRMEPLRRKGGGEIGTSAMELHRVCYVHVKGPSRDAPAEPS